MPITIENKCGLILGVANERSIAWGISKVLSNSGAEIALSYQNDEMFESALQSVGVKCPASKIILSY